VVGLTYQPSRCGYTLRNIGLHQKHYIHLST
jgi:hypothetical protein